MIRKLALRGLEGAIVTLLLASIVILLLVRLAPGSPVSLILGGGPGDIGLSAELLEKRKETLREEHGLNDSTLIQYISWFRGIAAPGMGTPIRDGRPVTQKLGSRIPVTFLLASIALATETGTGVLSGIYAAIHTGKFPDRIIRLLCIIPASLPTFVLSLLSLF